MDDFLIRFKSSMKQSQLYRRKNLKDSEAEIYELDKIFSSPMSAMKDFLDNPNQYNNKFPIFISFYMASIVISGHESINTIYARFSLMTKAYRAYYNHLQKSIDAFDNEKIKSPIQDLFPLFYHLKFANLSIEEKSKILGMAIHFDSQYALKHKEFFIKDIDFIHALSKYYNPDGTFKYNENVDEYLRLLIKLGESFSAPSITEMDKMFDQYCKDIFQKFATLLTSNNEKLKQLSNSSKKNINGESNSVYQEKSINRQALEELHKYYKNGKLVSLPTDLTTFYHLLDELNLSSQERKYICNLISEQLSNIKTDPILKYLGDEDKKTYLDAQDLFTSFKYPNNDFYALKQYIEELKTISTMLEGELLESDIEYLLSDVPKIIFELKKILDSYTQVDASPTNNLVFLSDKLGVPYLLSDIESFDNPNKKQIFKLLSKLSMVNKNQFRKIIGDNLPYTMYAIQGSGLSLTFVELAKDAYLVVGIDLSTNGYRESCNRLKSNTGAISSLKLAMKSQEKRYEILKFNEQYLDSLKIEKIDQKQKSKINL